RRYQNRACFVYQLRNATDMGGHHGPPTAERFQHHVGTALRMAGQAENISGGQPLRNLRCFLWSQETHTPAQVRLRRARLQLPSHKVITDTDQLERWMGRGELRDCLQQVAYTLYGKQPADKQQQLSFRRELELCPRLTSVGRPKYQDIAAIV